jgi:hypothetical protein
MLLQDGIDLGILFMVKLVRGVLVTWTVVEFRVVVVVPLLLEKEAEADYD